MPDSVTRFGGQTMSNLLSSQHEAMTAKWLSGDIKTVPSTSFPSSWQSHRLPRDPIFESCHHGFCSLIDHELGLPDAQVGATACYCYCYCCYYCYLLPLQPPLRRLRLQSGYCSCYCCHYTTAPIRPPPSPQQ